MQRLLLAPVTAILLIATHCGAWAQVTPSAYDYEFEAIEGGKLPLSQWRGKALLVVNVASFCGFTLQYEGLQKLWERYQSRGLVVMGVPANDFGAQEPKSEGEILEFCQGAFGVNFPMTTKQTVVKRNGVRIIAVFSCRKSAGLSLSPNSGRSVHSNDIPCPDYWLSGPLNYMSVVP